MSWIQVVDLTLSAVLFVGISLYAYARFISDG